MQTVLEIVGIVIGWSLFQLLIVPQILRAFYYPKFRSLCRRYEAKFRILSFPEKVQLLQASYMPRVNDLNARMGHAAGSNEKYSHLDFDVHFDNLRETLSKSPHFEKLSPSDLDLLFYKELLANWKAMNLANDYDFEGMIVELDHIFEKREELSKAFTREKATV